jgi:cytochrome c556
VKNWSTSLALCAVALSFSTPAWSGDDQLPIVKYRETVMEILAKHMSATSQVVKGHVDRKADLVANAQAIHDASKVIPELFPADSAKAKSESKPEVWTKWDDFVKANQVLEAESAKLVEVAKTGDFEAFKVQFGKVGGACGECHDAFRVED